jgi:hypothetical protein
MVSSGRQDVTRCVTCGAELHPERARKYNYCTAPDCQKKNFKGLTMVAIGMNKAADELMIADDQTLEDMASGKYRDQRRGSFGPPARRAAAASAGPAASSSPAASPGRAAGSGPAASSGPAARPRPARAAAPASPPPRLWTPSQQRLALLYNSQGMRPDEIAAKLGISRYLVTQIILAGKNRRSS